MVSDDVKGRAAIRRVWSRLNSLSYDEWKQIPEAIRSDAASFERMFITYATHDTDAMPTPNWMQKLRQEVAAELPTTLPEGRTDFISATMTEPKLQGKFRKYAFTCTTKDKRVINLSVSPTLLTRILDIVQAGENFYIVKQGSGLATNYIVDKWE